MTNSNNLERPPPPSTVSPGQGLGAPDSAGKALRVCKGRAAREAPAGLGRAAEDHSGPVRDGRDWSIFIKSGTKSEPHGWPKWQESSSTASEPAWTRISIGKH